MNTNPPDPPTRFTKPTTESDVERLLDLIQDTEAPFEDRLDAVAALVEAGWLTSPSDANQP